MKSSSGVCRAVRLLGRGDCFGGGSSDVVLEIWIAGEVPEPVQKGHGCVRILRQSLERVLADLWVVVGFCGLGEVFGDEHLVRMSRSELAERGGRKSAHFRKSAFEKAEQLVDRARLKRVADLQRPCPELFLLCHIRFV